MAASTVSWAAAPTVTTPTATRVRAITATLGANVTATGGLTLTRGTCWGTAPNPTGNCLAEGGTGTGVFSHARTGFAANTLYYYQGYAANTDGTSYSEGAEFTTIAAMSISKTQDMTFGKFVAGSGGSVIVRNGSGPREPSGGVILVPSSAGTAAHFAASGAANLTYTILHSGSATLTRIGGNETMTLTKTSDTTGGGAAGTGDGTNVTAGTLSSATPGIQTIRVGGTLTVGASQATGEYTGSVTVTVAYD